MIEVGNSRRALIYPAQNTSTGKISVFLRRITDIRRLRTLRTVFDLKFDLLSFFQRSKSVTTNCGVVHENVTTPFTFKKPITLGIIEPLDLTCNATHTLSSYLLMRHANYQRIPQDRMYPNYKNSQGTKKDREMLAQPRLSKSGNAPKARKSTEPLPLCQATLHFFGLLSIFPITKSWSTT